MLAFQGNEPFLLIRHIEKLYHQMISAICNHDVHDIPKVSWRQTSFSLFSAGEHWFLRFEISHIKALYLKQLL